MGRATLRQGIAGPLTDLLENTNAHAYALHFAFLDRSSLPIRLPFASLHMSTPRCRYAD